MPADAQSTRAVARLGALAPPADEFSGRVCARWDIITAVDPVIEAYKKDVDRTLIRENLRCTVEERILRVMELQRLALEARWAEMALPTCRSTCSI
jgi:hypothetical protein